MALASTLKAGSVDKGEAFSWITASADGICNTCGKSVTVSGNLDITYDITVGNVFAFHLTICLVYTVSGNRSPAWHGCYHRLRLRLRLGKGIDARSC